MAPRHTAEPHPQIRFRGLRSNRSPDGLQTVFRICQTRPSWLPSHDDRSHAIRFAPASTCSSPELFWEAIRRFEALERLFRCCCTCHEFALRHRASCRTSHDETIHPPRKSGSPTLLALVARKPPQPAVAAEKAPEEPTRRAGRSCGAIHRCIALNDDWQGIRRS